jgi:aryl-alcohol dehydrogenase-like predicted oxidoreductase
VPVRKIAKLRNTPINQKCFLDKPLECVEIKKLVKLISLCCNRRMRIVLGGASFNSLKRNELLRIFEIAQEYDFNEIDTAPLYGNSEALIGSSMKNFPHFRINTKVGLPDPHLFSANSVYTSVERSLNLLRIEKIGTLFIHTLPHKLMDESIRCALGELLASGKIERVGYSGDSAELVNYLEFEPIISDVMATFNVLDQGNREILTNYEKSKHIYIKRPLANGVFRKLTVKQQAKLCLGRVLPDNEYRQRFKIMFGSQSKSLLNDFVSFPLATFLRAKLVVGVSNHLNLKEIGEITRERERL